MDFSALLSISVDTIGTIKNVIALDWLGNIIKWLIEGCNSIGLGIIVFTLILKLITLPFDIISRVSTKKNAIKMEKMRPELEKLQRQYANNKELYQRKLNDLYKSNGYSAFASCLPTLLTLIIFIVVIGQFSTYSNHANFGVLCDMADKYDQTIINYDENHGTNYIIKTDSEGYYLNLFEVAKVDENIKTYGFEVIENEGFNSSFTLNGETSENIKKLLSQMINADSDTEISAEEKAEKALYNYVVGDISKKDEYAEKGLVIHVYNENGVYSYNNENFKKENGEVMSDSEITKMLSTDVAEFFAKNFYEKTVIEAAREASAEAFRNTDLRFLWVKNIWSQDLPWEHPIKENFSDYGFTISSNCFTSCSASCSGKSNTVDTMSEEVYAEITHNLTQEKSEPNGYLILVLLSIGTMLLSQVLMQKANKTQMELSSVDGADGTAAQSQKMMTWMMPIMFGVFSFMYTASFSIYIVVSSIFSTSSTMLINYFVEKSFEKKAAKEAEELELKRLGKWRANMDSKSGKTENNKNAKNGKSGKNK